MQMNIYTKPLPGPKKARLRAASHALCHAIVVNGGQRPVPRAVKQTRRYAR